MEGCPDQYIPKDCIDNADKFYFHGVFETHRPSSYALVVHHICRALHLCITRSNFRIALHNSKSTHEFLMAKKFLTNLQIPHRVWTREFDTYSINNVRRLMLVDVTTRDKFIWQVDSDEFVPLDAMKAIMRSAISSALYLPNDGCSFFKGDLIDRLPIDGSLVNITINTNLETDFPLACDIKKEMEKAEFRKLILYAGDQRPWIGNHKLLCEGEVNATSCYDTMRQKVNKHLFPSMPVPQHIPTGCLLYDRNLRMKLSVVINHYKYVWGVEEYLANRVKRFKEKKIKWASESEDYLKAMRDNGGIIDVHDPTYHCKKLYDT